MSDQTPILETPLQGWVAIAGYLSKTVRTVQRWEKKLGLPVHRRPDDMVYAYASEIDEWRRRMKAASSVDTAEGSEGAEIPGRLSPSAFRAWAPKIVAASAALVALFLSGVFATRALTASAAAASEFRLEGDRLTAYTVGGATAWSYEFETPVSPPHAGRLLVRTADLEGDGNVEVIVPVRFAESRTATATAHDAVFVFDRSGALKWEYAPRDVDLGFDQSEAALWQLVDVVLAKAPSLRRMWLVYSQNHELNKEYFRPDGPGFIVEAEPSGQTRLRYVQGGPLGAAVGWTTPAGLFLAVAGAVGSPQVPSLVLLRDDDPPATFLGPDARVAACRGCPPGEVRRALTFPVTEIAALKEQPPFLGTASEFVPSLWLQYREGDSGGAIVVFNPDFSFESFRFSEAHWGTHRLFERMGKLDHAADACPELRNPMRIREWLPSIGWRETSFLANEGDGR